MKKPEGKEFFNDLRKPEISKLLKEHTARILSNIESIMKSQGIIRSELAQRIGSEKSNVTRMFTKKYHKNGLTTNVLVRISSALDVKLTDLVK